MSEEINTQKEPEKTYTQADIDALSTAKQHEKESRQAAEAKVKVLEQEVLSLKSTVYGDEDKIKNSPLYKSLELDLQKKDADLAKLTESLNAAQSKLDDADLAKEISKDASVLPSAVDDILTQMKISGFKKTERGWLSPEGKNTSDFIKDLHTSKSHYFKRTVGAERAPIYNKERIEKEKPSARQMLTEIFSK